MAFPLTAAMWSLAIQLHRDEDVLDTNRRSRPRIFEAANLFAGSIAPRLSKMMGYHRPSAAAAAVARRCTP